MFRPDSSMFQNRSRQLDREHVADRQIHDAFTTCPSVAMTYIMVERQFNRFLTQRLLGSSLYRFPDMYRENAREVDKVHHRLGQGPQGQEGSQGAEGLCSRLQDSGSIMIRQMADEQKNDQKPSTADDADPNNKSGLK